MEVSARLLICARCGRQVLICSRCDRGNRYCGDDCARAARAESVRAAGRRHQRSRRGRRRHADRQRRWRGRRGRREKKVTHQGSPPSPLPDLLSPQGPEPSDGSESAPETRTGPTVCDFCGRPCPDLVRLDFLRTPRRAARSRQARSPLWAVPRRGGP